MVQSNDLYRFRTRYRSPQRKHRGCSIHGATTLICQGSFDSAQDDIWLSSRALRPEAN
jgi:hypothetical protein